MNLDYLSDQYRKVGSPIFTFEEKKCHDIIEALIESSKDKIETHNNSMKKVYEESFSSTGKISKPILSLMMWGPQNDVKFTNSVKKCDLKFDPDQEKLHEFSNYVDRDYWMYRQGEQFPCEKVY